MKIRGLLFLFLGGLCAACGNMRQFSIETYNPADVTYPSSVDKVLMVNHAAAQPEDVGYTYRLHGKEQDTCRAEADSALVDFCRSLGTSIVETSYFKDVRLLNEPIGRDTVYLADRTLDSIQVRQLCADNGTDAVISLEKLVFFMDRDVQRIPQMDMEYGTVKVRVSGVLRTYIPEKAKALATVVVADSVMWEEMAPGLRELNELLPPPSQALRAAASYIGASMSHHFIPHWQEATRWYYQQPGARWKEASAFASAGKWEQAEARWKQIENRIGEEKRKGEVYSNLALACEMQNRFEEAHEWAVKAKAAFAASEGEKGENTRLLDAYCQVLLERIQADRKLTVQIGE